MIRTATTKDLESISVLNTSVQNLHAEMVPHLFKKPAGNSAFSDWFRNEIENPEALVLVADEAGEIISYLYGKTVQKEESWIRPSLRYFMLLHIAVSPSSQRKGIGTKIMEAMKERIKEAGIDRIELDVWAFNEKARIFFTKHGFENFNHRMDVRI